MTLLGFLIGMFIGVIIGAVGHHIDLKLTGRI
jgi:ABC-type dipeptide/oligopeptide/nickel transport system permease subunit